MSGDTAAALHHASEASRLSKSLQAGSASSAVAAVDYIASTQDRIGVWQVRSTQLASLAQLAQLWDTLGCGSSASEAFCEGKQLVSTALFLTILIA